MGQCRPRISEQTGRPMRDSSYQQVGQGDKHIGQFRQRIQEKEEEPKKELEKLFGRHPRSKSYFQILAQNTFLRNDRCR